MISYKLIVSDFDGTLRRADGSIGQYTLDAIAKYRRQGGIFAVCTGRMTASIMPIVKRLGLTGLVISYQGNVITDIETGRTLLEGGFSEDEAIRITKALESFGYHIHVYTPDEFYSNRSGEILALYESIVSVKGMVVEGSLIETVRECGKKIIKIIILVPAQEKRAAYERLNALFGEQYYVTYSAANLVEITPKDWNKGTAVRFLADYYGIPIEETIALGDNWNDAPMLLAAGMGVAVANAADELKEIADLVSTRTNEEDSVGAIITGYGLGETI